MLADHVAQGRECTVACIEVPRTEASGFGVMAIDAHRKITAFVEKPLDPPAMPGKPDRALASMGVYIFNAQYLYRELARDIADPLSSHDFGKDIIPNAVRQGQASAHSFELSAVGTRANEEPYWRDVGTIDAYWQANIDLTDVVPELDLYDKSWPIWTYAEITPPAKFVHDDEDRRGSAISSLVSGDCIISGSTLHRSLLFTGVRTSSYARLEGAVVLPNVTVGRHAQLKNVVIDSRVTIPEGLVVGEDPELDAKRFRRSENGVCLITQAMIDKLDL